MENMVLSGYGLRSNVVATLLKLSRLEFCLCLDGKLSENAMGLNSTREQGEGINVM